MEHQLNGELVAALAPAGPDDRRLLRAVGALRSDPGGVRRLLDLVATDRSRAAEVARDSYWHANGFAKLTLHQSRQPAFKLRMHIWSGDEAPEVAGEGGCNTHTHRWAFGSMVVSGTLAVDEFEETDDPADPKAMRCHKLAYDSPETNAAGTLRPLGACLLRPTGSALYDAGAIHSGSLTTIHRVAPVGEGLTATVFVQGPSRVPSAFVYEEPGRSALEDTGTAITVAEAMDLATLVGDGFAAAQATDPEEV